jgi:hypothetical protein
MGQVEVKSEKIPDRRPDSDLQQPNVTTEPCGSRLSAATKSGAQRLPLAASLPRVFLLYLLCLLNLLCLQNL